MLGASSRLKNQNRYFLKFYEKKVSEMQIISWKQVISRRNKREGIFSLKPEGGKKSKSGKADRRSGNS